MVFIIYRFLFTIRNVFRLNPGQCQDQARVTGTSVMVITCSGLSTPCLGHILWRHPRCPSPPPTTINLHQAVSFVVLTSANKSLILLRRIHSRLVKFCPLRLCLPALALLLFFILNFFQNDWYRGWNGTKVPSPLIRIIKSRHGRCTLLKLNELWWAVDRSLHPAWDKVGFYSGALGIYLCMYTHGRQFNVCGFPPTRSLIVYNVVSLS